MAGVMDRVRDPVWIICHSIKYLKFVQVFKSYFHRRKKKEGKKKEKLIFVASLISEIIFLAGGRLEVIQDWLPETSFIVGTNL